MNTYGKAIGIVLFVAAFLGCTPDDSRAEETAQEAPVADLQTAGPATYEDWPTFLGPRRDGTSKETGFLTHWPEDGPPVIWERSVGTGYGAPVVSAGRLIFFHRIDDEEVVECVSAKDGIEVHWTYTYPTAYVDDYGSNDGPRSSPTIDDGRVYTYGAEGVLTCLDFQSGSLIWQRPVNEEFRVPKGFFGAGTAPVIENDLLILNVGGPNGAGVVAFNKVTGETIWKSSVHSASYSTPIIATIHSERLAIFHTGDGLLAVEVQSGEIRHEYPFRSPMQASAIAATPVLVDDIVLLTGSYEIGSVALQLHPDGLKVVWKDLNALQSHWATPICRDGYVYGVDGRHEQGSKLKCIEFATGKEVWRADKGLSRASFILAEGLLISIDERGTIALIKASPEGYEVVSSARGLRHAVRTPPILAQGLLYVRSEREMKCLDLRRK